MQSTKFSACVWWYGHGLTGRTRAGWSGIFAEPRKGDKKILRLRPAYRCRCLLEACRASGKPPVTQLQARKTEKTVLKARNKTQHNSSYVEFRV
jgi:hypothetical protein